MNGFKRMLFGEKMPDKNDPKYKDRYEREVKAGRRFAQALRLDKAACIVQHFADIHKKMFLVIVFGFLLLSFGFNMYRITQVYNHKQAQKSATELQDSLIRERHKALNKTNIIDNNNKNERR